MLNELKVIADGLDEIGEGVELIHRDIFLPGGSEALRIVLGEKSSIDSIEYMNATLLANCWGIRTSNQDQFPCIKLTSPLRLNGNAFYSAFYSYQISKAKDKQKASEKLIKQCELVGVGFESLLKLKQSQLTSLLLDKFPYEETLNAAEWPKKSYRKSILDRFYSLTDGDNEDIKVVAELYRRFSAFENDGVELLRNLSRKIEESLRKDTVIPNRILFNLLFGESPVNEKGDVKDTTRSILVLDYKPSELIDEFASDRQRIHNISKYLNKYSPVSSSAGTCFLTGRQGNLISDKFPEKNLGKGKSVSKVILFSKFDNGGSKSTVQRYRKSGTEAYCLDSSEGSRIGETIVKVTSDQYKGKMWCSIPSESHGQDLLIAFCKLPNVIITPIITGHNIDDIDDYVDATSDVINSFNTGDLSLDASVDFIILRKIDDGNQKVIYSSVSSIKSLNIAAGEWFAGAQNVPPFKLFAKIGNTKDYFSPWPIAPQQLVYKSGQKYIRDGQVSIAVPAISFSDVMKLFLLGNSNKKLAKRCLTKLAGQYEPLFTHCALSKVQSVLANKAQVKTNPKNNTQALNAVTLMAVLLYIIGRKKEVYMNGFAYQLGQLCSAMDELHIGYCKSVRGGQVPNTLIGNLTYSMALQSPIKALAVLASRIKPYEMWAKKELTKGKDKFSEDKAIRAGIFAHKWLAGQSEKLSAHFSEQNKVSNDSYKAELMLGYLAGRPFEDAKLKTNSNSIQGEK